MSQYLISKLPFYFFYYLFRTLQPLQSFLQISILAGLSKHIVEEYMQFPTNPKPTNILKF